MLEIGDVYDIINQVRPDETIDLFRDAFRVFDLYGLSTYLSILEDSMYSDPNSLPEEIIDKWLINLKQIASSILTMQGIVIQDDVLLSDTLELLEATKIFIYNEDKETLFRQLDQFNLNNEEIYAEIIENNSILTVEKVLTMVISVPHNFVDIVKNMVIEKQDVVNLTNKLKDIKEKYIAFKNSIFGKELVYADKLIQSPATIGLDLNTYVSMYTLYSKKHLENTKESYIEVARELFALSILSEDFYNNPSQGVRNIIGTVYTDITATTAVISCLNQINGEMVKNEKV